MKQNVDILMAVYNNAEYIAAQLQSLIAQTYSHFRIIIRDDCSSDHSVSLIENFSQQYPEKIVLIRGTENLGARGNFAALMHHTTAHYIMFCDADDIWLPTKIEESLALMQKNEKIYGKETPLLIHTDLSVVDKQLGILSNSFWDFSRINPRSANSLHRLLVHNVITGCTMLINKPLLQLAIPIPKEAIMHDWWIGLVASAFGHVDFLAKPTILYRQHGKNDIGAKNWKSLSTYWGFTKKTFQLDGRQELHHRLLKTIHQASQFSHRYEQQLECPKKQIIQKYVALGTAGAIKKRYIFLRHRFFKNTFAKNVGMFLFL
jgi:glycosyltransferase involved in cell wall biosynthesis